MPIYLSDEAQSLSDEIEALGRTIDTVVERLTRERDEAIRRAESFRKSCEERDRVIEKLLRAEHERRSGCAS